MATSSCLQNIGTQLPANFVDVPGFYAANSYPTHPLSDRIVLAPNDWCIVKLVKLVAKILAYIGEEIRFYFVKECIKNSLIRQVGYDARRKLTTIDDVDYSQENAGEQIYEKVASLCSTQREAVKLMSLLHQGALADPIAYVTDLCTDTDGEIPYHIKAESQNINLQTDPSDQKVTMNLTLAIMSEAVICRRVRVDVVVDLLTEQTQWKWTVIPT